MPLTFSERQQDLERDRSKREERFGRFTETFRHNAGAGITALSK